MTPDYSRFTGLPATVTTFDNRNLVFQSYVTFRRDDGTLIRNRIGSTSDGFSTPAAIWPVIPPFGDDAPGSWFHDWGYRDTLEMKQPDGTWAPAVYTQAQSDALMLEILTAIGASVERRQTIYRALVACGKAANLEDELVAAIPHGLTKAQLEAMQAHLR